MTIQQNLEIFFDSNLREVPLDPPSYLQAISLLKAEINPILKTPDTIKKLGLLGSYLRIMGFLDEAEEQLALAILLASELNQHQLQLTNIIRMGHVKHWRGHFEEAHRIFDQAFDFASNDQDLSNYLDFIYQHKGKCFFDEEKYELALANFHKAILIRNEKSEIDLLDSTLLAVEETKRRWLPQVAPTLVEDIMSLKKLPHFVKEVLGKRHGHELPPARLNCINGAMNFHGFELQRLTPMRPIEMLEILTKKTTQLTDPNDFQFGDFVVWWNRSDEKWSFRKIIITDMKLNDPDFPYGLIFDHVAVRLTPEIVFHKPNPSPSAEYRLDFLETASYPSKLGPGSEITFHRIL